MFLPCDIPLPRTDRIVAENKQTTSSTQQRSTRRSVEKSIPHKRKSLKEAISFMKQSVGGWEDRKALSKIMAVVVFFFFGNKEGVVLLCCSSLGSVFYSEQ